MVTQQFDTTNISFPILIPNDLNDDGKSTHTFSVRMSYRPFFSPKKRFVWSFLCLSCVHVVTYRYPVYQSIFLDWVHSSYKYNVTTTTVCTYIYCIDWSMRAVPHWSEHRTMIPRQPLAPRNRCSHPEMTCQRPYYYWILVQVALIPALWIIQASTSTTTAFQLNDYNYKTPTRRTFNIRSDTSLTTASPVVRRIIPLPKSTMAKVHPFSLYMVKNRVGLEQKRESATPTGANDSIIVLIYCI